jgi:hypothetical protein
MKIGNIAGYTTTKAKAVRQARVKARAKANTNSLFQTSSKKSTSAGKSAIISSIQNTQKKKNYTSIKDAADRLQTHAGKLLANTDDSLFGGAIQKTGGSQKTEAELASNKEKVVAEINSFITDYNSLIDTMGDTNETVNNLYLKQLKGLASEHKAALKELGITQKSDGTLTVDQKTLKSADVTKLQKVFGSKDSFTEKVFEKSKDVEDNADINLASLNKSYAHYYDSSGYLGSGYDSSGSLYNTKG